MDPNYSDTGVIFEDDAMRHTINTPYNNNGGQSKSKFANWLMDKFPFIKDENTANYVLIAFSVIIFIISIVLFTKGEDTPKVSKEQQEINKAKLEEINLKSK